MAFLFRLPDLGEGISEAEIIEWLAGEGDVVAEHQPLLRVETDKALVEIPSPAAGRLGRLRHRPGDTVRVGETLVAILGEGDSDETVDHAATPKSRESTTVVGVLADESVDLPPPATGGAETPRHEVLAMPAVRRLARELGIRLEDVRGSGIDGRVTEADVREAASGQSAVSEPSPAEDAHGAIERIALRGIRRTIAKRLRTAVAHAALATHMDEIDVTALMAWARTHGTTAFAWIAAATAQTLRRHPRFNATFDDAHEELLVKRYVHLGIAVDTTDGLMVPVLRDADQQTVEEIAAAVDRLATACRQRSVGVESLRGGTFSISNIGALGGTFATPIPNYPEVAILATGRIAERLARAQDGSIVDRMLLPVSLSFDHRVLDGADAARFVNTLREILAEPERLR